MKIIFLSLIFILFSLSLEAKTITKRVACFGLTKQKAVTNALIEAISQVKGVHLESLEVMKSKFQQSSISHNGIDSDRTSTSDESISAISKATKGIIQSYNVIKISKKERGYEALVDIKLAVYKAPGISHKSRRKIAIMPFYVSKNSFTIGSKNYSSSKISDDISQVLTTNITQSRRFAVVDRTYTRDMAKELGIISSGQTPLSQKVKLGQKLGADYILVGTIKSASMQTYNTRNQLTGEGSSKSLAEFIIDYRIIVVGTSQIKWSDSTKAILDMSNSNGSVNMALQNAIEKVSSNITNSLLGNIYPIRIVQITRTGDIVLNQGGNSIQKGMRLDVMNLGKKIIDPYTKESLGRTETKTAEIEITRVTPKLSYAKVIDGTLSLVKKK